MCQEISPNPQVERRLHHAEMFWEVHWLAWGTALHGEQSVGGGGGEIVGKEKKGERDYGLSGTGGREGGREGERWSSVPTSQHPCPYNVHCHASLMNHNYYSCDDLIPECCVCFLNITPEFFF